MKTSVVGGKTLVTVTAENYLRLAEVYSDADTPPYSDNFVDILPGESKEFWLDGAFDVAFKLRSVGSVKTEGNKLTEFLKRAKIFLNPVNFFSWLYYRTAKFEYSGDKEE